MNLQRTWVTPLMAGAFLVSAVTGVLIFFHLDLGGAKVLHEWISWLFLVGAVLHLTLNFTAMLKPLKTRLGQVVFGVCLLALAATFVPVGGSNAPPFVAPINALAQAPLTTLAQVAQLSDEQLMARLAEEGLKPTENSQSLNDLIGADLRQQMQVLGKLMKPGAIEGKGL